MKVVKNENKNAIKYTIIIAIDRNESSGVCGVSV